jgi:hypothetical protein
MTNDLGQFHEEFFQDILIGAEADGQFAEDTFFDRFSAELVDAGEIETADRVHFQHQRGLRVDGYGGSPVTANGVLSLLLVDYSPTAEVETLTKTDMDAIFKRGANFVEKCSDPAFRNGLEESSPVFGLADMVSSEWEKVTKVRLILMSNRLLSSRIDAVADGAIDDCPLSRSVWDLERLGRYVTSGQGREDLIVDLEADFGGGIPLLPAHLDGAGYESYLAVIPGRQLAEIYDRWGPRLLEQNVRVFLQARGNVNKGIRVTIENDPQMFFAYNNGVTATAEAIGTNNADGGLVLTRIDNLQIVNGGQTTASIHAALRNKLNLDRVFVQMKLSIVDGDKSEEVVPKISEFANSQNRVNAADFFSNHPYHVRMQEFSRRIFAPAKDGALHDSKWFYERARGQYQDARGKLTKSGHKKFEAEYPKKQTFTKTDLAKYLAVWECKPDVVSKGAQKNFVDFAKAIGTDWDKAPDSFNEAYYRTTIAKAVVFRAVEKLVTEQEWYEGGYRANIVAYAIAKLAFDVKAMGKYVDFASIWGGQALPPALEQALLIATREAHEQLVRPDSRYKNVTEWAKQQACWNRVSEVTIEWPREFEESLVSKAHQASLEGAAVKVQKIDNSIDVQTTVVSAPAETWRQLRAWGTTRNLLTKKETDILDICGSMPAKIPTDKQCAVALEALRRLHGEGCRIGKNVI